MGAARPPLRRMEHPSSAANRGLTPGMRWCGMRRPFLLLVLLLPVCMPAVPGAARAEPSARVTSDTPEYCGSLAARIASNPAAAREPSRSLAAQGVELCGNGHVRTGIAKLRRALRAAQASAVPAGD
jgi:hypothetical protein